MTPAGELVLVRQERIPGAAASWEFPAGQMDEEDAVDEAVIRATVVRELGRRPATNWRRTRDGRPGVFLQFAGVHERDCHMYLARGVVPVEGGRGATTKARASRIAGRSRRRSFAGWWRRARLNNANTLSLYARLCARGLV